jgi:hypothetical protein
MVRYTDAQILEKLEGYRSLVDDVNDRLRLAPLNQQGIYTVAHASNHFQIINEIYQQISGVGLIATIHEPIVITRRIVLNANPEMPEDEPLSHVFAGIPLEVQDDSFILVAYDKSSLDYVLGNAERIGSNPQSMSMRTKKGVDFYLTGNENVNGLLKRIV